MKKVRWSLSCLGALTLLVTACGRSDDSGIDHHSVRRRHDGAAATTAPDATATTVAGGDSHGHRRRTPAAGDGTALTAADIAEQCASEPLEATEVGVSAETRSRSR